MKKHVFIGIAAAGALLALYFGVLGLAQGLRHTWDQTAQLWPWLGALSTGFGVQVGLFSFLRRHQRCSATGVTASGGLSAGSMVACCAHHLSDVLPLLGLSGLALFLTRYQTLFLAGGLFSNALGITLMLEAIQRHNLCPWLGKVKLDLGRVKKGLLITGPLVLVVFWLVSCSPQPTANPLPLAPQIDAQGDITLEARPIYAQGKEVSFAITVDTHSDSLDYDLTQVASLEDSRGNKYSPQRWEGSGSGGHHREGTLIFPPLASSTSSLKLTLLNTGVPQRTFFWEVPSK